MFLIRLEVLGIRVQDRCTVVKESVFEGSG